MVSPVIEYANGADCEPLSQIPHAIECRLVDIAVDASKSDLAERRRVGAAPQALKKKSLNEMNPLPFRCVYILFDLTAGCRVHAFFPEGAIRRRMRSRQPRKTVETPDLPIAEPGALGHLMQAIDPRPLEDAKFSKGARYVPTFEVQ
jgi:hypothetical protein